MAPSWAVERSFFPVPGLLVISPTLDPCVVLVLFQLLVLVSSFQEATWLEAFSLFFCGQKDVGTPCQEGSFRCV